MIMKSGIKMVDSHFERSLPFSVDDSVFPKGILIQGQKMRHLTKSCDFAPIWLKISI